MKYLIKYNCNHCNSTIIRKKDKQTVNVGLVASSWWLAANLYNSHDIRRDVGQITCSGNHGIHEFPLQRIQKQFDTFPAPPPIAATAAGRPKRTASAPRASIFSTSSPGGRRHQRKSSAVLDSIGIIWQYVGRTSHAIEDAAAMAADDDTFCSGIGTGNGFFWRHDAFYDKWQLDRPDDFCNINCFRDHRLPNIRY